MQEVERYQVNIAGLNSRHSTESGTKILESGWTLYFSRVAQVMTHAVWGYKPPAESSYVGVLPEEQEDTLSATTSC